MFVSLLVGFISALFGGALAGFLVVGFYSGTHGWFIGEIASILGWFVLFPAIICGVLTGLAMSMRKEKMPKNALICASVIFSLAALLTMYSVLYASSVSVCGWPFGCHPASSAADVQSFPAFLSGVLYPFLVFTAMAVLIIYMTTKHIAPKSISA